MSFYCTKSWKELRKQLIVQRGGECEKCHNLITDTSKLIGHHIEPITEVNKDDINITLNPKNVEILCLDCHNNEHGRFGNAPEQKVYIVWGAPCSGKNTYVEERARFDDLILDIDCIYKAITPNDMHVKSGSVREIVFNVYRFILEQIKFRAGRWRNAYIICGFMRNEVNRMADSLGAQIIEIKADKQECLIRAKAKRPSAWLKYIDDWFESNPARG